MTEQTGKKSRQSGFTLVEAMVALVVFSAALMGLVGLQKVSISAATLGREHTAAANVARFAMTWLQNEAAHYSTEDGDLNFNVDNYPLLFNGGSSAVLDTYVLLDSNSPTFRIDAYLGSSALNIYDPLSSVDTVPYCVHYKLQKFGSFQDLNGDGTFVPDLFKATVRVTWPKEKFYRKGVWTDCEQRTATPNLENFNVLELGGVISREFANKI